MANGLKDFNSFDTPTAVQGFSDQPSDVALRPRTEFEKGVKRGTANISAGLGGAAQIAGQLTGNQELEQYGEQQAAKAEAEASDVTIQGNVESVFDINDLSGAVDWALGGIGSVVPFAAVTIAGGVTGGIFGRGIAKNIGARQSTGALVGAGTGAVASTTPIESGSIFREIQQESGIDAPVESLVGGFGSSLLNLGGPASLLKRLPGRKSLLGNVAQRAGATGLVEGTTEAIQEGINIGTRDYVDPNYDSLSEESLEGTIKRLAEAGALGAVAGGVLGAPAGIVRPDRQEHENIFAAPDKELAASLSPTDTGAFTRQADPAVRSFAKGEISEKQLGELLDTYSTNFTPSPIELQDMGRKVNEALSIAKDFEKTAGQRIDKELTTPEAITDAEALEAGLNEVETDPNTRPGRTILGGKGFPWDKFYDDSKAVNAAAIKLDKADPRTQHAVVNIYDALKKDVESKLPTDVFTATEIEGMVVEKTTQLADFYGMKVGEDPVAFLSKLEGIRTSGAVDTVSAPPSSYISDIELHGPELSPRDQRAKTPYNARAKELRSIKNKTAAQQKELTAVNDKLTEFTRIRQADALVQDANEQNKTNNNTQLRIRHKDRKTNQLLSLPQLTRRMLDSDTPRGKSKRERILNAFHDGLTSMMERGYKVDFRNLSGDLVIHNAEGTGNPITLAEVSPNKDNQNKAAYAFGQEAQLRKRIKTTEELIATFKSESSGKHRAQERLKSLNAVLRSTTAVSKLRAKATKNTEQEVLDLIEADEVAAGIGDTEPSAELIESITQPTIRNSNKTQPLNQADKGETKFKNIADDKLYDFEPEITRELLILRKRLKTVAKKRPSDNKKATILATKVRIEKLLAKGTRSLKSKGAPVKASSIIGNKPKAVTPRPIEGVLSKAAEKPAKSFGVEQIRAIGMNTMADLKAIDTSKSLPKVQSALTSLANSMNLGVKVEAFSVAKAEAYARTHGFNDYIAQMQDGSLHGFTTTLRNGKIGVFIHPKLKGALRNEIIAHEFGHVVFRSVTNKVSNLDAALIRKDFNAWATKFGRKGAGELLRSKKTPRAALLTAIDGLDGRNVKDLSDESQAYLLDFEEWFADGISKYVIDSTTKAETPVQQFFKTIAKYLKIIATRLGVGGHRVFSFGNAIVASPADFANAFSSKPAALTGAAQASLQNVYSDYAMHGITNVIGNSDIVSKIQNGTLKNQVRKHFKDAKDSELTARAFQLWQQGKLHAGPKINAEFKKIQTKLNDALGNFQQMDLPARSTSELSMQGEQTAAVLERTRSFTDKVLDGTKKFFYTADSRLRDTKVPVLIELANMLHVKAGIKGADPTMWEQKQHERGRFDNTAHRIFKNLNKTEGKNVLAILHNPKSIRKYTANEQLAANKTFELMAQIRTYMNKAGMQVGNRGDQYFPWIFDTNKFLTKTTRKDFTKFVLDNKFQKGFRKELNIVNAARKQKFDAEVSKQGKKRNYVPLTPTKFAHELYNNIADNDGVMDFDSDVTNTPGMRSTNRRQLDFVRTLGNESDVKYLTDMMSDDLGLALGNYISQAVKRGEYTRRFGIDDANLNSMMEQAVDEGASLEDVKVATDYVNASMGVHGRGTALWLDERFGLGAPPGGRPINSKLQSIMGSIMVYQNIRLLALATFTSLADPLGIAARTGNLGLVFHGFKESVKTIFNNNQSETKDLAEMLGIIDYAVVNEALGWEYGGAYMTGTARKLNEGFFKWSGLTGWTRMTRVMATASATKFLARHVARPNKHSTRYLEELNLTAGDVLLDKNGGLQVLSYADRKTASHLEIARDDKVRAAIVRFVDESILRPNPSQRPLWASDPHYMLAFHLKSFMYSFHDRILKRVWHEMKNGNYAHLAGLMAYVPAMIAADLVRELVQFGGDDPKKENWGLMDYVGSGFVRAGLPGVPGLTAYDIMRDYQYGGIPGISLAGPTIEQITDPSIGKAMPLNSIKWLYN